MPTHLRSLTSLRFFAAALVVVYHAAAQSTVNLDPGPLLRFGYLGVSFFFVLSGTVLVWSAREDDRATAFFRRRFARVWPLHALTFLAAGLLGLAGFIEHYGPAWSGFLNLALLQTWVPAHDVIFSFNGLSWSLSDEAFFYACFPLILWATRRRRPATLLLVGALWLLLGGLAAEALDLTWFIGTFPAYRVGEFCVGMALGLSLRHGVTRQASRMFALSFMAASYAGAVVANRLTGGWVADRPWLVGLVMVPGIVLVIGSFAARDASGGTGWLCSLGWVRLGQWSFALYMVHDLVLRVWRPLMLDHRWTAGLAAAFAVFVAGLSYEYFERPLERRLRGNARAAHLSDASSIQLPR